MTYARHPMRYIHYRKALAPQLRRRRRPSRLLLRLSGTILCRNPFLRRRSSDICAAGTATGVIEAFRRLAPELFPFHETNECRKAGELNEGDHRDCAWIECGATEGSAAKTKPVRFVGAILRTDYRLQGSQAWAMAAAARGLNDHVRFERHGPRGSPRFTPSDALERHYQDKGFIDDSRTIPFEGDTVVVTHHAPHPGSLAERFAGETRILCNPKGYGPMRPGQALHNPLFDAARIIEI